MLLVAGCSDPSTGPGDLEFLRVTAGVNHTCALTSAGVAYCWGSNLYGQLGAGAVRQSERLLVSVSGGLRFTALSAGAYHTCGLAQHGAAYCWGKNDEGQLGSGTRNPYRSVPVRAAPGNAFASISAGATHTCGTVSAGVGYCWGNNEHGQLGDGTLTDRLAPTAVAGNLSFEHVQAGPSHSCGIVPIIGEAYCWGTDDGRLGDGTIDNVPRPAPSRVITDTRLSLLGTTHGAHICALGNALSNRCWGRNESGQLGDGTTITPARPVTVAGPALRMVGGGSSGFSCGLTFDGTAWCWGRNARGQLGDGTTMDRMQPVPVAGGLTFAMLAVGASHGCGVTNSWEIYCWGVNDSGQLGTVTTGDRTTPIRAGG